MRVLSLVLMLGAAVLIGACGDKAEDGGTAAGDTGGSGTPDDAGPPKKAPIALAGAAWDGGEGIDPTETSDKVRVIQFLKPG